jgi:hypothetical protein
MDKSVTLVKSGSDNIMFFLLYGTTSRVCQGGEFIGWYREEGLSDPVAKLFFMKKEQVDFPQFGGLRRSRVLRR